MKKVFALSMALILFTGVAMAQKIGYVDSNYIMEQIPEYEQAQTEIENISKKWQDELERRYQSIEQMYTDYTAEEVLLPEAVRQERQEEIFQAEREAKEYREEKFGYSGELFRLQESKVQPIQDKVFKAVEAVAARKRFDFVFDKAGEVTWLYTNATYDLTTDVLEELGFSDK
ncbi:MAG: OmpH family outer membrane protein [Bacteroidota bacterium]